MRTILYFLAGLLTAPGALLAAFIWAVGGVARQKGWRGVFHFLWDNLVRLLDWGMWLILALLIAWLILAFVPKYRFIGALLMALVAVASLVEFFVTMKSPEIGDLFFPLLSVTGLFLNLWLAWDGIAAVAKSN